MLITTQVQNYLDVSVIWMLLCQSDVGSRGTLGAGVSICPQSMGGALQAYSLNRNKERKYIFQRCNMCQIGNAF